MCRRPGSRWPRWPGLEIVLGIDNIVFISILSGKLPEHQQRTARQGGLALALISRILLLFSISWIVTLTEPLFPRFRHQALGEGSDPPGRRAVPRRQGHVRDPRAARRRRRGHGSAGGTASLARRARADPPARRGLLDRLGHHGRRDGPPGVVGDHVPGRHHRRRDHADLGRPRSASSSTSTRPSRCWRSLPDPDRHDAGRRGVPLRDRKGSRLRRDGVLSLRRGAEPAGASEAAGRAVHLHPAYAQEFLEPGTETVPAPSMVNRLRSAPSRPGAAAPRRPTAPAE